MTDEFRSLHKTCGHAGCVTHTTPEGVPALANYIRDHAIPAALRLENEEWLKQQAADAEEAEVKLVCTPARWWHFALQGAGFGATFAFGLLVLVLVTALLALRDSTTWSEPEDLSGCVTRTHTNRFWFHETTVTKTRLCPAFADISDKPQVLAH